jgi:predicted neuraminidase
MDMTRLASGAVMAVFDNSPNSRVPLAVALSDDDGRTWSAVANVVTVCGDGECSYPSLAADPTDGSAWITYTHARQTIGWVHVSEAWVRQKGDVFAPIP